MRKKFLAGSNYFFSQYPDYQWHDNDYIILNDDMPRDYWHYYDNDLKSDFFYWKINTPEWHINYLLEPDAFALDIGHLLIPEVARIIGITIQQLKQLEPLVLKTDEQVGPEYHYNIIIFQAYIANNDFILTDEQRLEAYQNYKKTRPRYNMEDIYEI